MNRLLKPLDQIGPYHNYTLVRPLDPLSQRWEVKSELGKVYHARPFSIPLPPNFDSDRLEREQSRLVKECQRWKEVLSGRPEWVDAFCEGQTLYWIERPTYGAPLSSIDTPLTLAEGLYLTEEVLHLLDEIHAHRDFKSDESLLHLNLTPANIWRSPEGQILLMDPLLPTLIELRSKYQLQKVDELDGQKAPELTRGRWSDSSDLYGVGMSILSALSGLSIKQVDQRLQSDRFFKHDLPVPDDVRTFFEKLTAFRASHRFETTEDALEALYALPIQLRYIKKSDSSTSTPSFPSDKQVPNQSSSSPLGTSPEPSSHIHSHPKQFKKTQESQSNGEHSSHQPEDLNQDMNEMIQSGEDGDDLNLIFEFDYDDQPTNLDLKSDFELDLPPTPLEQDHQSAPIVNQSENVETQKHEDDDSALLFTSLREFSSTALPPTHPQNSSPVKDEIGDQSTLMLSSSPWDQYGLQFATPKLIDLEKQQYNKHQEWKRNRKGGKRGTEVEVEIVESQYDRWTRLFSDQLKPLFLLFLFICVTVCAFLLLPQESPNQLTKQSVKNTVSPKLDIQSQPSRKLDPPPIQPSSSPTSHPLTESKHDLFAPPPPYKTTQVQWISLEGGTFMMGSSEGEEWTQPNETPPRLVKVDSFQMSQTPVTVRQYQLCVQKGYCSTTGVNQTEWGDSDLCNWDKITRKDHPMNCVSWRQALQFAHWVGARLPSEAEWAFAAQNRGQTRLYPWGSEEASCTYAHLYDSERGSGCGSKKTAEVCSYTKGHSQYGLCDLIGNVWEWVLDEAHRNYKGAPTDGRPWLSISPLDIKDIHQFNTLKRVVRGGGSFEDQDLAISARRRFEAPHTRRHTIGFRIVKDTSTRTYFKPDDPFDSSNPLDVPDQPNPNPPTSDPSSGFPSQSPSSSSLPNRIPPLPQPPSPTKTSSSSTSSPVSSKPSTTLRPSSKQDYKKPPPLTDKKPILEKQQIIKPDQSTLTQPTSLQPSTDLSATKRSETKDSNIDQNRSIKSRSSQYRSSPSRLPFRRKRKRPPALGSE